MSSRRMFAECLGNMLSPVLLALALRMVGLNGEGTWFMLQGISISSITITTVVILWVTIWKMVPQAIFFVALASSLIHIIMVYKNYMIIVLPLLDFMMHILSQLKMDEEKRNLLDFIMHIWSQLKMDEVKRDLLDFIMHIWSQLKMDEVKRTEKSPVDGGRQLSMMSQQTLDQEEAIENSSTVDQQQLMTSMTSRQKMGQEEQIESSRVDEEHLTRMTSQQTMNQEDQAESSRLHGQKIDKGKITRVDEQQLTSMTSNEIEVMEQEEQIEIIQVGEPQYMLTGQQTKDKQKQIESSRIDEQHLTSMKSQQRMNDQEAKLLGVHNLGLPMTMTNLYLLALPGLLRTSHQYGTPVWAGMVVVSMLALCSQMLSPVWSHSGFAGTENYIISASVVISAYGLLLLINTSYIKIIIVPIAILIFIVALWHKFRLKSGLKMRSGYYVKDVSKSVEELLFLTALPYYALYFEAFFPNSLALSHFLWFLSSSLGAVAIMIALLPVAATPGGAQVLQLLHRTCITVLTITVHTKAAEWVREDTALVFTPELVTVLVWFMIPFRLGVSDLSIHSGILRKSIAAVIFVVLGYTTSPAYQYKRTRALRACSYSGCLTYFSMYMLQQWPGSKPVSELPVKLLEFFAKNCFIAAAVLAVMSATHGDFINYMLVDTGRAILLSVYLFLFLLLGPADIKKRFLGYLVPIVATGSRFIHLSQRLHSSLIYFNRRLRQCAQYWLGETSPDPSSGKFKTQ